MDFTSIVSALLHPYRLPLRAPLRLAFGTLTHRDGVLLRLEDAQGRVGWGDAAPLPGFSPDTLAGATAALERYLATGDSTALPPSAQAALDGAQLEIEAQRARRTLAHVLTDYPVETVSLAALLTGDDDAVAARAAGVREAGYRAAKLKVGAGSVTEDVARARAVAAALGPDVALRLDANRAWTFEQAADFAEAVADVPLAYVEEPLHDPARLADLVTATGLPVALDESLLDLGPNALAGHPYAVAVVLKPVVLGGVRAAWGWAQAARALGMAAVVSAAFESGVGTRHALALGAALGSTPAGLDAYNHLAADVLHPRLPLTGPTVPLDAAFAGTVRV
jgi:o-succinylbenzoate synthase